MHIRKPTIPRRVPPAALTVLFLAIVSIATACRGGGDPSAQLDELQRTRVGDLDVILLSPDTLLKRGQEDMLFVEFRSPGGDLVDVGTVKATATMPMKGMPPMMGSVNVAPADAKGRYAITTNLAMAGDWQIGLEWNGPGGSGATTLSAAAR